MNLKITESSLRANIVNIENNACEVSLRLGLPVDLPLITDYVVTSSVYHNYGWGNENRTSVGIVSQFNYTRCILQPGRYYYFYIQAIASLTDPDETFYVNSNYWYIIIGMLYFMFLFIYIFISIFIYFFLYFYILNFSITYSICLKRVYVSSIYQTKTKCIIS